MIALTQIGAKWFEKKNNNGFHCCQVVIQMVGGFYFTIFSTVIKWL